MLHTVPFRLVKDKIIVQGKVNGGRAAGLRARHRLRGDGDLARDGAARGRPSDHLHAQRRRRRGRPARPAARAPRHARHRHAAGAQPAGAHQEPGAARHPEARRRELLAAVARHVDDDRLPDAAADDRADAAGGQRRLQPADARASPRDGARRAELDASGLLRRRHRRRGDLDQRRHGERAARSRSTAGSRCGSTARPGGTATRSCCPA